MPKPSGSIPLLLTSSIVAHDPSVRLKDAETRLHHVLESIDAWLAISPGIPIVICDGSNFDLAPVVNSRFPAAQIECLFFSNDTEAVQQFGRGYGEGEIVKHALENSLFIQRAGCFAKCTAKLWVKNFSECAQHWNHRLLLKGVFHDVFTPFKKTYFAYIDTRFYIVSCDMYRRFFLEAHRNLDPANGHSLEEAFLQIVQKEKLQRCLFPVAPVICGVGGGTGVPYKNPLKRILKEKLRLLLVRYNKEFAKLFN